MIFPPNNENDIPNRIPNIKDIIFGLILLPSVQLFLLSYLVDEECKHSSVF